MPKSTFVVTFHTTADAIQGESLAKAAGLPVKMIPAPRSLSPGCGMALSADPGLEEALSKLLRDQAVEVEQEVLLDL